LQALDHYERLYREYEEFVSDGGPLDWCAHWRRWEWNSVSPCREEEIWERTRILAGRCNALFILNPQFEAPYDGFRWLNKENRAQQLRLMRGAAQEWRVESRTAEVKVSDLDQAKLEIQSVLDRILSR
ncbi:MAG: hypothetical protein KDD44_12200, partial [Bdellovibrionales bacterium]|nr:hypothetical protein [Bdellovibrionales bacterium]